MLWLKNLRALWWRTFQAQTDFEINPVVECLRTVEHEPRQFVTRIGKLEFTADESALPIERITSVMVAVRVSYDDGQAAQLLKELRKLKKRKGAVIYINNVPYELGGFMPAMRPNDLSVYFRCPKMRPENNEVKYAV